MPLIIVLLFFFLNKFSTNIFIIKCGDRKFSLKLEFVFFRVSENSYGNGRWFCSYGIYRFFRKADPYSNQQYYCWRLKSSIIFFVPKAVRFIFLNLYFYLFIYYPVCFEVQSNGYDYFIYECVIFLFHLSLNKIFSKGNCIFSLICLIFILFLLLLVLILQSFGFLYFKMRKMSLYAYFNFKINLFCYEYR